MKGSKRTTSKVESSKPAAPLLPVKTVPALAILLVLGVLIYSNSFDCSFHFDDGPNITDLPLIRDFWNFRLWWNVQSTRQLSYGSFALTYHLFGYDVWGWHLVNLLVHLATSLAVWRLTALLFRTPAIRNLPIAAQAPSLALAAGLMFVAHPLATQSVTYIVQRIAAQAALFYLLSLGFYVHARLQDVRKPGTWLLYGGALVSGICAILSKENAYTLPLAVLLVEIYFFQSDKFGSLIRDKRFLVAATVLLLIFLRFVQMNIHLINYDLNLDLGGKINSRNYLLTQFSVIWKYIGLLFVPLGQSLDHQITVSESLFRPGTFVAFIGLVALLGWGVFLFNRNRLVSFGILWFFLTLSVESSFLPIADVIFEHRTYLPSFGFFVAACAGILFPLHQRYGRIALILLLAIVAFYAVLTYARNRVWKNDETLWSDVISRAPTVRAYNNRGDYYYRQKQYDKAVADFNAALKIYPEFARAYRNLAKVDRDRGRPAAAIESLSRAISLKPTDAESYLKRGDLYYKTKAYDKALADSEKAISLDADNFNAYLNRSAALNELGRHAESLASSSRAISLDPKNAEAWYNRGNTYRLVNNPDSSLYCFTRAIELDSTNYFYFNNRAIAYRSLGKLESAIGDFSRALALEPFNLLLLMNRSVCYLDTKKWSEAAADLDVILGINPNYPGARQNRDFAAQKLSGK